MPHQMPAPTCLSTSVASSGSLSTT